MSFSPSAKFTQGLLATAVALGGIFYLFNSNKSAKTVVSPPVALPSPKPQQSTPPQLLSEYNLQLYEDPNTPTGEAIAGFKLSAGILIQVPEAPGALEYEWQLSSNQKGRGFSQSIKTATAQLDLKNRDQSLDLPGFFFLKYRYLTASRQWTEWSNTTSLRVILAPPLISTSIANRKVSVEWTALKRAAAYEVLLIQAAEDGKSPSKSDSRVVREPIFEFTNLPVGAYGVRVRTLDETGWPTSPWSVVAAFDLQPLNLKLSRFKKGQRRPAATDGGLGSATSVMAMDEKKNREFQLWVGLGSNFLRFEQSDRSSSEGGEFAAVTSPTAMIEAILRWNRDWEFRGNFHQMPGKIRTAASQTIDRDSFNWSYLGLEAERTLSENFYGLRTSLMGGLQRHQTLFLISGAAFDVNLVDTNLNFGTLGLRAKWAPSSNWTLEASMRYNQPLSSESADGGSFTIGSSSSFDGLLGMSRRFSDQWRIGMYWFGQSLDMKYNYTSSDGSQVREGDQRYFNSNLQLRLGYDFSENVN